METTHPISSRPLTTLPVRSASTGGRFTSGSVRGAPSKDSSGRYDIEAITAWRDVHRPAPTKTDDMSALEYRRKKADAELYEAKAKREMHRVLVETEDVVHLDDVDAFVSNMFTELRRLLNRVPKEMSAGYADEVRHEIEKDLSDRLDLVLRASTDSARVSWSCAMETEAAEPIPRPTLRLSQRTLDCLLPLPPFSSWDWIKENGVTHKGAPFNYLDFPWVEGICAAWDNPRVRMVSFMAGSRLGKTESGLELMQSVQDYDPDIGMIGGSTEGLIKRTLGDRYYKMLEHCHRTRSICPPVSRRSATKVKTKSYIIYGAWSGSPTTLGDLDPRYLVAFEVDKFTKDSSEEADPFLLLLERGAEIPDRKVFCESTPTVKGVSRIDRAVESGTNRRFHCPCPRCGHYQELVVNESLDREFGGLWWDKDKSGHASGERAAESAVYICAACKGEIREESRRPMIRKGIWCAKGQQVSKEGELLGRPINDGPHESFQLSRMYGPTFSFSAYARAFVESRGDTEKERSFANNWAGVPWVPIVIEMDWEELARRLCRGKHEVGVVPQHCIFVTTAVDVQVDHFVITTFGWTRGKCGHLVQHGTVPDWSDVQAWLRTRWKHEDGGVILSRMNLIDAKDGNRKHEIVDFCKAVNNERGPFTWPSMGAKPGTMHVRMFRKQPIDDQNRTGKRAESKIRGIHLVQVNTTMTQEWIDSAMVRRMPTDPHLLTLSEQVKEDQDLFDQLLNEKYDKEKGLHVHVDPLIPVDFRDAFRYARTAAEVYTNGNWDRLPGRRTVNPPEPREQRRKRQRATAESTEAKERRPKPPRKSRFIRRPSSGFIRGGGAA